MDDDGNEWPSKWEWQVFDHFRRAGSHVERCDERHSISYCEPKPNVKCLECGSSQCGQDRYYTPDLLVVPKDKELGAYYVEAKGYFRAEKRTLFRCMRKSRPDVDLRVVFEADHWVTRGKTRISDYFNRYMKDTPYAIGLDDIPEGWI